MFGKKIICLKCHEVGYGKTKVRGSAGLEIMLWLMFIIPGVLYTAWRSTGAYKVCKACGSADIVPVDSPRGKNLIGK